jgi:hypothetical protein
MLLAPAPAAAEVLITGFDTGPDGWQVSQGHPGSPLDAPTWFDTGGNPDGYVQFQETDSVDDDLAGYFYNSGPPFAGDRSTYYGDNLSFDLRINGPALNPPVVILFAGDGAVYSKATATPGTSWTSFSIPLFPSDWKGRGSKLTKTSFKNDLANLTAVLILADYQTATGETTDLDNVALSPFTGQTVNRSLSLAYAAHAFRGKLRADDPGACPVSGQSVKVLLRRRGPDQAVGIALTDATGAYVLKQPARKKGAYYALTSESHTSAIHCLQAVSPSVHRG